MLLCTKFKLYKLYNKIKHVAAAFPLVVSTHYTYYKTRREQF